MLGANGALEIIAAGKTFVGAERAEIKRCGRRVVKQEKLVKARLTVRRALPAISTGELNASRNWNR